MDDDSEILRKADALLSRRSPSNSQDFPVLTEVVVPRSVPRSPQTELDRATTGVLAKTDLPSSDIETLEHRILARALAVIELRIPVVIDKLLHERMDNLFTQLASRMEQELSQSMTNEVAGIVHEAVTHAVKRAVRGERASDSPIT